MTEPASDVIEVAVDGIYREAAVWDEQSTRLADCAFQADHLAIDVYDTVVFNEFLASYNEVTREVARLCTQGRLVTRQIAQTLRTVADTYDAADDRLRTQYDRL